MSSTPATGRCFPCRPSWYTHSRTSPPLAADVNTCIDTDGNVRFNAVWVKDARDAEYRPTLINGYETADGEQGWNALFVKQGELGPAREWRHRVYYKREDFDAEHAALAEQFDPTYFHTIVLPGGTR